MDYTCYRTRIKTIFILSLVIISFSLANGWALDPTIVDVTTKSISVVWTEDTPGDPSNCTITLRKETLPGSNAFELVTLEPDQIIYPNEAEAGYAQKGLERGIVKIEVIGLDYFTQYEVSGTDTHGNDLQFDGSSTINVYTENFRGLTPSDPEDNDIVTNDIFHFPVYLTDGTTPALGTLAMGEIFADANCSTKICDYPITALTGEGMPGKPNITYFDPDDPNSISYKEFAALNMNNLFDPNHYPLQLTGSEYVKIEVIPGTESIAGDTTHIIPLPPITMVGEVGSEQMICSAKASQKIDLKLGLNTFTYPFEVPSGYTLRDFILSIFDAGGSITYMIYWKNGWQEIAVTDYREWGMGIDLGGTPDADMETGRGYLIYMNKICEVNLYASSSPIPSDLTLFQGLNIVNFSQVSNYYTIRDLGISIFDAGGVATYIITWDNGWKEVVITDYREWGMGLDFGGEADKIVERDKAYMIYMSSVPENPMSLDPLL